MPVVKALSVGYIELIRGVPLITILFMSSVMIPLFFPSGFNLDKVLRAQIGVIMFYSAYLAEVVRGGLQAIPKGQEEAAAALGLTYWKTMAFIVMPQALRIMIPPLVSTLIALLKDTSLVAIIGLFDLLAIASLATANPLWLGKIVEAYVFIAVIYWALCFSMSRYSIHLERKYNTAQR
jgi:general L-amino acid transport system permease protein